MRLSQSVGAPTLEATRGSRAPSGGAGSGPEPVDELTANYTPAEEQEVIRSLREGRAAACPRCGAVLERREVPPREGVPYVRDRLWLVCGTCARSVVVDARRTREER